MFKKIFVLTLCALMLLTSAMAEGWTAPEAGSEFTEAGDIGIAIDGNWYNLMNSFDFYEEYPGSGLHEALGEPLDTLVSPSCAFKGDDKEFDYDGIAVYTNPYGGGAVDVLMELVIDGGDWTTSRGIGIGATADDIVAAYGDGYFEEGSMIVYSISGDPDDMQSPCIMFTMEDGAVTLIDIYYPTNTI